MMLYDIKHTQRQTDTLIHRYTDRQTDTQSDKQTHRYTDTQTDTQTSRPTGRQTEMHGHKHDRMSVIRTSKLWRVGP